MERVDKIIQHPMFRDCMKRMEELEYNRRFCRHGWNHIMDVARIACLMQEEVQYGVRKDVLYAAAFLHDLGRIQEYEQNVPHEKADMKFAEQILMDCGYDEEEIDRIMEAIAGHNKMELCRGNAFAKLLYDADKASRLCFTCPVYGECKWSEEQKNKSVVF